MAVKTYVTRTLISMDNHYIRMMVGEKTITVLPQYQRLLSKPKFKKEVASEYGVSVATLSRMCRKEDIDLPSRGLMYKKTLYVIYSTLGFPEGISV